MMVNIYICICCNGYVIIIIIIIVINIIIIIIVIINVIVIIFLQKKKYILIFIFVITIIFLLLYFLASDALFVIFKNFSSHIFFSTLGDMINDFLIHTKFAVDRSLVLCKSFKDILRFKIFPLPAVD